MMIQMIAVLLLSAGTGAAVAAQTAQTAPAVPAAAAEAATARAEQMVCKREEQVGTRLGGKRVCKKRGDWEAEERELREQYRSGSAGGMRHNRPGS